MSKYCFANFQKMHSKDVGNLQREANREFEESRRYKNDVRLEKSDQNFYFARCNDWVKKIDEVLKKYEVKKRKDSVVLTTTIYGFSKDWEDALYESGKTQDEVEEQKKEFFKKCFEFEKTRGECINFIVHTDEAGQWHAHAATVPITSVPIKVMKPVVDKDGNVVRLPNHKIKYDYDYKKDENGNISQRYALNAKAIFGNRRKMSEEQTRFYETCGKSLGMERGECRIDDTEEDIVRHMSEVEYKAKARAKEQAQDITDKARDDAQAKRMEANSKLKEANQQIRTQTASLEARKQELDEREQKLKNEKKEFEDYKAQQKQAIEDYKAQLKTDSDKKLESLKNELKTENEDALELLKAQLESTFSQRVNEKATEIAKLMNSANDIENNHSNSPRNDRRLPNIDFGGI